MIKLKEADGSKTCFVLTLNRSDSALPETVLNAPEPVSFSLHVLADRTAARSNNSDRLLACYCRLFVSLSVRCLGGAVVQRRTRDQKVAGSTPGRGAIKSTRSTQPSIPTG